MSDKKNKFMIRLKKLRKAKGLTQPEIAEILGVASRTISNWEMGVRMPNDVKTLVVIADYFDVTVDYLLGRSDNPKAEILQTTFLDENGKEHTLEVENEVKNKEDKLTFKDLAYLITILKKLGIDPNKINLPVL